MRVLGIGDNVVDRYLHINTMFPGGNSLNFCVYSAMMGADSAYLGVFGGDREASLVKSALKGHNVDFSHSRETALATNRCSVDLYDGDRDIGDDPNYDLFAECPIVLNEGDLDYVASFDVVHTSIYAHIEDQLSAIRQRGPMVVYDFSHMWTEELLKKVCPNVDVAFFSIGHMSDSEGEAFLERAVSLGCRMAVGTRGKRGACVANGRRLYSTMPYNALGSVKDTLGAGDSFLVGFVLNLAAAGDFLRRTTQTGDIEVLWSQRDREDFYDRSIESAMAFCNLLAARTCQVDAAFGQGAPIDD